MVTQRVSVGAYMYGLLYSSLLSCKFVLYEFFCMYFIYYNNKRFRNKSEEDSDVKTVVSLRGTITKTKKCVVIMKEMKVAH